MQRAPVAYPTTRDVTPVAAESAMLPENVFSPTAPTSPAMAVPMPSATTPERIVVMSGRVHSGSLIFWQVVMSPSVRSAQTIEPTRYVTSSSGAKVGHAPGSAGMRGALARPASTARPSTLPTTRPRAYPAAMPMSTPYNLRRGVPQVLMAIMTASATTPVIAYSASGAGAVPPDSGTPMIRRKPIMPSTMPIISTANPATSAGMNGRSRNKAAAMTISARPATMVMPATSGSPPISIAAMFAGRYAAVNTAGARKPAPNHRPRYACSMVAM